jgi:hypothetical protein
LSYNVSSNNELIPEKKVLSIEFPFIQFFHDQYFDKDMWSRWILMASHLFKLANFGGFLVHQVFPSFPVPDFWGHFEALNNVFRACHSWHM